MIRHQIFVWPFVLTLSLAFFSPNTSLHAQGAFGDDSFDSDLGGFGDDSLGTTDLGGGLGGLEEGPSLEEVEQTVQQALASAKSALDQEDATTALEKLQEAQDALSQLASQNSVEVQELAQKYQADMMFQLGRAYKMADNVNMAMQYFERARMASPMALQESPDLVTNATIELGNIALDTNQFADAIEYFESAISSDPQSASAHYHMGKAKLLAAVFSQTDPSAPLIESTKSLHKAIEIDPNYGDAFLMRGRVLVQLSQMDLAIEDLTKAVTLLGKDSDASAELAKAYAGRGEVEGRNTDGDTDKIVADFEAALRSLDDYLVGKPIEAKTKPWDEQDPLEVRPINMVRLRADVLKKLGDEFGPAGHGYYSQSIAESDRLLALDPESTDAAAAYFNRAVAKRMLGQLDDAVQDFTTCLAETKKTQTRSYLSEASLRRGIIFFHQGKYELAVSDFENATSWSQNPFASEPRAAFWLGLTYAKQGKQGDAIRAYTQALRSYPEFVNALLNRGLALTNMGRYEMAIEDFSAVVRLDPKNQQAKGYLEIAKQRLHGSPGVVSGAYVVGY